MACNSSQGDEDWVIPVKSALRGEWTPKASSVCIFRAPPTLVNQNEEAYIPQVVPLGPYFFRKPELHGMEKHKSEVAPRVQSRIPGNDFSSVVAKIQSRKEDIRNCYDEDIRHGGEVLSLMMARDGSFILEFLRRFADDGSSDVPHCRLSEQYSVIFDVRSASPILSDVVQDMFKTGNQIPIFVLEEILELEMQCSPEVATRKLGLMLDALYERYIRFVGSYIFPWKVRWKPRTLLELLHYSWTAVSRGRVSGDNESRAMGANCFSKCFGLVLKHVRRDKPDTVRAWSPSAVDLYKAGVKLRPLPKGSHGRISNIRFDEKTCTLYLPHMTMTLYTEALMRNFMVLEACSPSFDGCMTIIKYANFMDSLINAEEDVALLRRCDIIESALGSDAQTAEMFSSVSQLTHWIAPYPPIDNAIAGVHKYYEKRWKILCRELWEGYCSKPWLVAGSLAATLVLLMIAMQVFCLFYTCN